MRIRTQTSAAIIGLTLVLWGLGEGARVAQAGIQLRPRRVRVVHRFHQGTPRNQLLLEGALALPQGDLDDSYWTTAQGFGADIGYEIGGRYRYFVTPWFAVAPAFHYVRFGEESGAPPPQIDLEYYAIKTSIYRYAIDLQAFVGEPEDPVRFYVTGGVGLSYNRYRDESVEFGGYRSHYVHGEYGLGLSGGAGLQFGPVEISAVFHYNRFDSESLSNDPNLTSWDWDYVTVRGGISLGRF